ncbi:hypothetical protein [Microbulbifer taiwanensis]|uniref:Nuclear transport factor 2 family protein n=1 Tax=Microbulbifer taiwanensis TaxID=986746 RepID=A0ABW1YHI7_9GAMM|nr:hypothetical protein [Microbulbifer taiwanensis]
MKNSISFKEFWPWLTEHPNCIVRAGTADSVIYDDDDYFWRFTEEDVRTLLVQVMRGKRPVAEMFIEPEHVTSVQITPGEKGEFNFDLVTEMQGQPQVIYYFVLTHAFEEVERNDGGHGRLH